MQARNVHALSTLTSLSALLLGAALLATPALAVDEVAGAHGASVVNRDAPVTLPGNIQQKPLPKVDPASLSRGLGGMDADAAADSMATLSHSADGTDSETPASGELRGFLADSSAGSGKSEMSTDRVVVGTDDRTQVTDISQYPLYTVGWLIIQDQKGDYSTCTGTMIGPKSVITAAHCVYDHDNGGWAKDVIFAPAATDAQTAPVGVFEWADANILKGFVTNYDGKNYGSAMPWDLAEIELKEQAGDQVGWMGFRVDDGTELKATVIGYPGDKPEGTMWKAGCDVTPDHFGDQLFWHDCDTFAGSSGSAMWDLNAQGEPSIRGINVAEDDNVNYGVRLIDPYFKFIQDNYK